MSTNGAQYDRQAVYSTLRKQSRSKLESDSDEAIRSLDCERAWRGLHRQQPCHAGQILRGSLTAAQGSVLSDITGCATSKLLQGKKAEMEGTNIKRDLATWSNCNVGTLFVSRSKPTVKPPGTVEH